MSRKVYFINAKHSETNLDYAVWSVICSKKNAEALLKHYKHNYPQLFFYIDERITDDFYAQHIREEMTKAGV